MSDGAPLDDAVDRTLRRDYRDLFRRTWEIELIISGAVLFALVQVPPAVSDAYDRVSPQTAGTLGMTVFLVYYYIKLTLYTLIVSFVLHLAGRAYWVGLIGLDSVFPEGIRWTEVRFGPVVRDIYRRRLPTLDQLIERTDRVCSVLFSLAFSVIFTFAASLFVAAMALAIGFAAAVIVPGDGTIVATFWTLYTVIFIVPALLAGVDRRYGHLLREGSRRRALLVRIYDGFLRLTLARWYSPINLTVSSHLSRTAGIALGLSGLTGLILLFIVNDVLLRSGRVELDSYALLPADGGSLVVNPVYYETTRAADAVFEDTPHIQAEVITGPYIRLFVPIPARRLERIRDTACPDVADAADAGLRLRLRGSAPPDTTAIRRILACLSEVFPVRLDGQPIDVDYRVHTAPSSGVRGILARVPVDSLAPGPHTLSVPRVPRARDDDVATPPPPHVIPFWR